MSRKKKKPTPIDGHIHAKATDELEDQVAKELSEEQKIENEETSLKKLFSGGTIWGGEPYAQSHTINGCNYDDCECKSDPKEKGHNWHEDPQ